MRWTRLIVFVFIAAQPGCTAPTSPPPHTMDDREIATAQQLFSRRPAEPQSEAPASATTLQLMFHVWRFEMSKLPPDASERIFKHLDETAITFEQARVLKSNGLRAAVGAGSSWPIVRALILEHNPQQTHYSVVTPSGHPLKVELAQLVGDDPLFLFGPRGHLKGARFSRGVMCWHVEHAMDIHEVGRMECRILPELLRGETVGGNWMSGLQPHDSLRFEELAFDVLLDSKQFVIIGPSERARLNHLLGTRFVSKDVDGLTHDIYYCLLPKLVRQEIASGGRDPRE